MTAKFAVLEVVRVCRSRCGEVGKLGVIVEIREYLDKSFRYRVSPYQESDIGGIYDEADLDEVGKTVDIQTFREPGEFQVRDIVEVADSDLKEKRPGAILRGAGSDPEGNDVYYVRLLDTDYVECIISPNLKGTGKRLPPDTPDEISVSKAIDEHGNVLGSDSYYIRDSIDFRL